MTLRTAASTVTFRQPFSLPGVEGVHAAGTYTLETDEELIEGVSFPVYRRLATMIVLPSDPGRPGCVRIATIDPAALQAALERDKAPELTAPPGQARD